MNAAAYPDGAERRSVAAELRAAGGRTLRGYAAVWDRPARIGGTFDEVVRRGAFTASLASGGNVFLLSQHDWTQPLARTGNGSLALREDDTGLAFEATIAETRAGDDVLALARSGTLLGASIGFRVPSAGDRWPTRDKRELTRIDLLEVSAVTVPAYAETTISARAMARASGYHEAAARIRAMRLVELGV